MPLRALREEKFNPKQLRFVGEYLIDLNGTQAAIRAGYSPKTAKEQASRLLTNVNVRAEVERRQKEICAKLGITQEKVVTELANLAFSNMGDYMKCTPSGDPYLDFSGLTREQQAALVEVTVEDYVEGHGDNARDVQKVKFKLADKRAALVDLGRHLGIFKRAEKSGGSQGSGGDGEFARTLVNIDS